MDDVLWDLIQSYGVFLLKHIGLLLIISWIILWLLIWYFGRLVIDSIQITIQHSLESLRQQLIPLPYLGFLYARLNNKRLDGLPLTLAFIVFISLSLLLFGVVEDFVESDFIVQFDHWIAQSMVEARGELVVKVFKAITIFGNFKFVLPFFIISVAIISFIGNRFWIIPLIISFGGSIFIVTSAKFAFARHRPIEALLIEQSPSFPSGHATVAMSFYAILFYLWYRNTTKWNTQVSIIFVGSSFVSVLAISRIILGVHYISDVIAGLLLGGLWFVIAISLYEWLNVKKYIKFGKKL